jgi:hypothetical protein
MNVEKLIEKLDVTDKNSIAEVLSEGINDNGVTVGSQVAVVNDPTYPFDGCRGKVKKINAGFADVEFANGTVAPLEINLLIPVQ